MSMILGYGRDQKKIISQNVEILADSGYQGIQKIHQKSRIPIKKNEENH